MKKEENMLSLKSEHVDVRRFMQTREEIATGLIAARPQVILIAGVHSNAAWLMCLDALDQIRRHPNYRQRVKKTYGQILKMQRKRELDLQYAKTNRYFCLNDMDEKGRALLGDATDKDYYDYWTSFGSKLYYDTRKSVIADLMAREKAVLDNHGIPHSEILQYALCAGKCLASANVSFRSVMTNVNEEYGLKARHFMNSFKAFDMYGIHIKWVEAMFRLEPKLTKIRYTEEEWQSLEEGAKALSSEWGNPANLFGSVIDATQDYADTFPTLAEQVNHYEKIEEETIKNL